MIYTNPDLIRMQAEALFEHDASGRLLRVNERDNPHPAPRFFLTRGQTANLWRARCDLPDDLAAQLERLAADEPVGGDLSQPPRYAAAYARLLKQQSPAYFGPAWYLPESDTPHDAVTITPENIALAREHFAWLLASYADYAPVSAAVVDGKAVAICFCSRITAKVAEAGVHTEDGYRGRGLATSAARGWAAQVRASGRLPLYSTSWENRASQAVAQKLGGVLYGANYSVA